MPPVSESADVVICGGAAIGSSVAYHLAADPGFTGRVVVIEKDPTYRFSASALSAASIRQQFSSAVNIRISLFGIDFLRSIGSHLAVDGDVPAIDLHEGGYLYLASEAGAPILKANQKLQAAEGADIALYDPAVLKQRFPGSMSMISPAAPSASAARAGSTAGPCSRPSARRRAASASNIGKAK